MAAQWLIHVIHDEFSSVARPKCWYDPRIEHFRPEIRRFAWIWRQCTSFRLHGNSYSWYYLLMHFVFQALRI